MAQVYVGTYRKYNEGSIKGGWLNLADYPKYGDFLTACKELHKDERDPEFMIQDTEDFPDGLSCMEWLSESDFNDVKLAMREEQQEEEGKPSINIIEYSDKAFAVVGDTYPVRMELKSLGGCFNKRLSCGSGWIFSNKQREAVEKFINSGEVATKVKESKPQINDNCKKFIDWLDEYVKVSGSKYKKDFAGAIKLHDRFYLIEKPSIKNRFCFHDEGPNYEFYKELMADEEKLTNYFMAENLAEFDNKIEHVTKDKKPVWWYTSEYDKDKIYLDFSIWGGHQNETECTEEETKLILEGLRFGRDLFNKRLEAYIKRYGVSKLHTWTYWADA